MTEKKSRERLSNVAYVAIILGIVAVVNLLGYRYFGRMDLTANKVYSVSPVTRQILSDLDDVVSVKAYFSKKLPVQLSRLPGEVDDLLEEYRVYSHGNIQYERIDPGENEELKQKLSGMGVMPVTMTIIEKDERQQINGFLALVVSYGEKTAAIPLVQNTSDLEYELTSRIFRLTSEPQHIGIVTSFTRHDISGDYRGFAQEVQKIHELDPVDLTKDAAVPESIRALIFAGPADSVPEAARYAVDQYIMRGGRVIFLVDNIVVSEQGVPREVRHGLGPMLASYGFNLNGDVIQDVRSHSAQQVSQGMFTFNRPNPFFPHVIKGQFGEHAVVARLSELTLPWTGSLVKPAPADSSVKYSVLAFSSAEATSHRPPAFQPSGPGQAWPLIVLATGRFQSAFRNRPDLTGASGAFLPQSAPESSVMVIPSSSFLENRYLYPGNLEFMLNAVDFLSIGDKLISIRTRPTTDSPLKQISGEMKNFLRLLNIVCVPFLVILFGMLRFYLKRRDKAVQARSL
jgi:gliding-associated putative ABC transporter substrate-binding component GldG